MQQQSNAIIIQHSYRYSFPLFSRTAHHTQGFSRGNATKKKKTKSVLYIIKHQAEENTSDFSNFDGRKTATPSAPWNEKKKGCLLQLRFAHLGIRF